MATTFTLLCICTLASLLPDSSYGAHPQTLSYASLVTPNNYDYVPLQDLGVDVNTDQTSFVFYVRASNDAHVALHKLAGNTNTDMYEIVIGGWGNTRSVIRTSKQGANRVSTSSRPLSSQELRPFWVSWENNVISVGSGKKVGISQFMAWTDPNPRTVNFISVSTGWGATGQWRFDEKSKVYTPNQYNYKDLSDYGLVLQPDQTSLTFEVRAKNDAHLALYQHKGNTNQDMYEIVIGGWGNSQSVIRTSKQGTNRVAVPVGPLSEQEVRPFWVSWVNGVVRVGTGRKVGVNQFMAWTDPTPHQVNYIGVSTGWGSTGTWWIDTL